MRTPKYRFLLGANLHTAYSSYSFGYYDKVTGNFVSGGSDTKANSILFVTPPTGYVVADNTFLKSSSYMTVFVNNTFSETIQLSSIMGVPYVLPQGVTRIGITVDVTEMESVNPYPLYLLHQIEPFYSKLTKKIAREGGQMFFRETLDTDLHLVGSEADAMQLYSVEDKFVVVCERWDYDNQLWRKYHADTFSHTDCKFDLAAHTCTPNLTPLDNYSRLLARYSDEYDLIKLKPEICKITTSLRPIIELYEKGSSVITRFLGGTYWETEVTPEDDENKLANVEHFEVLSIDPNWGYLDVKFNESFGLSFPSVRYYYDPQNNYYYYRDDTGFWAWVPEDGQGALDPYGYVLRLTLNGQIVSPPSEIFPNAPMYINLTGMTTPSDLPVNNTVQDFVEVKLGGTTRPIGTVSARLYNIYGRVVGNKDVLFGQDAFDLPQDDFAIDSPSYKKCAPLTKNLAKLYLTTDSSNVPTIYGIKGNPDEYYTNENLPVVGGLQGVRPMPIGKYEWGEGAFWYNYPDNYALLEQESRHNYELRDCFTLGATIRALLAAIDPSITFSDNASCSQFFYNPYGFGVTMKGGYDWKLAISPKSNILKGDYDQAAQKAPITFEELMSMLRDLYNLYWYIDDDNKLHIEHLVWFLNGGSYTSYQGGTQLDLTDSTVRDAFNKKMTGYWQKAYEFNMSEAARRLEFTYAEKGTEFFEGLSVDLLNSYLRKASVSSKSISNFTADIDLMRIEPNRYSSDGFALLAYIDIVTPQPPYLPTGAKAVPVTGAVTVIEKDGWQRQAYINNLFASWLYCQHFYMYNLSGDNVKVNLKLESLPNSISLDSVHGLARLKKQKVRFPFDDDPDTIDLIKTDVGYGVPEDFEVEALSRTVETTLSFPVKDTPVV